MPIAQYFLVVAGSIIFACLILLLVLFTWGKLEERNARRAWHPERERLFLAISDMDLWCGREYPILTHTLQTLLDVTKGREGFSPHRFREYLRKNFPAE